VEIVLFTGVGMVLYLVTGQLLNALERLHGEPLPQRNIIFFVIIVALSLPTFSVMRSLTGTEQSPQNNNQEQQATDGGDQTTESH
jgi:hypothetical protein